MDMWKRQDFTNEGEYMSTPVIPISLIIFKMIREFELTQRTIYSKEELFSFAHSALKIAGQIDNEDYWILSSNKYGVDFYEKMNKICDIDLDEFQLNVDKYYFGGKKYANKIIGAMPYSFLKGALQTLREDLNLSCLNEGGRICD